jgi:uncharacterized protein YukE
VSSGIVKANAGDVRLFASQLTGFNGRLADESARLSAQFRRLGETWADPQYAKFGDEFVQTMRSLERFRQYSEEVIPRLNRLAERIDAASQF